MVKQEKARKRERGEGQREKMKNRTLFATHICDRHGPQPTKRIINPADLSRKVEGKSANGNQMKIKLRCAGNAHNANQRHACKHVGAQAGRTRERPNVREREK